MPSRTLRCFLAEGLRLRGEALKLEFFRALSTSAETRRSAGYIYESWFHSFFFMHDWVIIANLGGGTEQLPSTTNVILATQDTRVLGTSILLDSLSGREFPGIDSAPHLNERNHRVPSYYCKGA